MLKRAGPPSIEPARIDKEVNVAPLEKTSHSTRTIIMSAQAAAILIMIITVFQLSVKACSKISFINLKLGLTGDRMIRCVQILLLYLDNHVDR